MNKVRSGTPKFDQPSLCLSCDNAQVRRGERDSDLQIQCHSVGGVYGRVTMKVTQCNEYEARNTVSLREMHKMAWHIDVDRKTREFGFSSPKDRDKDKPNY